MNTEAVRKVAKLQTYTPASISGMICCANGTGPYLKRQDVLDALDDANAKPCERCMGRGWCVATRKGSA